MLPNDSGNLEGRRFARRIAFEVLSKSVSTEHDRHAELERRLGEAEGPVDFGFARMLVQGVEQYLAEIDEQIAETAAARPSNRLTRAVRTILRIAVYELVINFDSEAAALEAPHPWPPDQPPVVDSELLVTTVVGDAAEMARQAEGEAAAILVARVLSSIITRVLRRRARLVAFEALFEHDVSGHDAQRALDYRLSMATVPIDMDYARSLVRGVEQHLPQIDASLSEAATAWPLDQMARVDKAILRLAIHELVFDNDVPVKAVINEAVELAKLYGGESSPRFVNGVLGTIAGQAARQ